MSKRRIARSTVLWWLATFVLLHAAFDIGIETFLTRFRYPALDRRENYLQEAMAKTPDRPLVLILGSSRTLYGIRPSLIEEEKLVADVHPLVFNCSDLGRGPTHLYVTLTHLLREGIKPHSIVLEIAPITLWHDDSEIDRVSPAHLTWRDLANYTQFREQPHSCYVDWLNWRILSIYSYRQQILDRHLPKLLSWNQRIDGWREIEKDGWTELVFHQHDPKQFAFARDHYKPIVQQFRIPPKNLLALVRFADLCKSNGIQFFTVVMPESREIRSWYSADATAQMQDLNRRLASEFGATVIDAHEWMSEEKWYSDGHHLTPTGATEFSRRFFKELLPSVASRRSNMPVAHNSAK